jgi:hypothetical protein
MPRRPDFVERDVPLYLVPHVIMRGVKAHDDDLERVLVKKTHSHFYTVSIRTRTAKREYRKAKAGSVPVRPEVSAEDGCGV